MTKEELQNIIEANRFSSLTCRTGDEIGDLVQEIYHDGGIRTGDIQAADA